MTYEVEIAEKALKALKKLPKKDRQRIESHIDALSIDPRPTGCKNLEGNHLFIEFDQEIIESYIPSKTLFCWF